MREINFEYAEWPKFAEMITDVLRDGISMRFQARGSSMYPFIHDGDILTIEPVDTSDLKRGDVVLYRTQYNEMITHRIIDKAVCNGSGMLRVRGDSIFSSIEHIHFDQVIGRVKTIQREHRSISTHKGLWKFMAILWIGCYPLIQIMIRFLNKMRSKIFSIVRKILLPKTSQI